MKSLAGSNTFALVLYAFMSIAVTQASAQAQLGSDTDAPSADNLMRHVYVLADDSMMGRALHTDGYDMAAGYVAATVSHRVGGRVTRVLRSTSTLSIMSPRPTAGTVKKSCRTT